MRITVFDFAVGITVLFGEEELWRRCCLRAGCCDAMRSRGPDALGLAFWVSGISSGGFK